MDLNLNELALGSDGGDGVAMTPATSLALEANFGSVERWRDEFVAIGQSHARAAGWLVLLFQPNDGTLVNRWVAEATPGLDGGMPILAVGAGQHLHPTDRIDWAAVYQRYQHAVHEASEPFGASADEAAGAMLLDVRRAGVFAQAAQLIPGARWCDPAGVKQWAAELPAGREVLVYCVYGHEVGRTTALRLRAAGLNARFLRGGIDAWQAAGRPLSPKGDSS